MTLAVMNRITISLIFLIVISMFLPTSAIMYASGQSTTDNSGSSSTGGSTTTDSSGSSSTGGSSTTTDSSGSSSTGGSSTTTDSSGSSSTGGSSTTMIAVAHINAGGTTTTDNSATLPTTSTASDNTGNILKLVPRILRAS